MGPDIEARGAIGEISLLDLAPTFLFLMGESPRTSVGGKPIQALVRG